MNGEARRSLTITNTGSRRGTEIVHLYAADTATGVTLPAQQLVGFARVDLEPDESKTVAFVVPLSLLAYTGLSGDLVIEPGPVELSAATSSIDTCSKTTLTITGTMRVLKAKDRAFLSATKVAPRPHQGPNQIRRPRPQRTRGGFDDRPSAAGARNDAAALRRS